MRRATIIQIAVVASVVALGGCDADPDGVGIGDTVDVAATTIDTTTNYENCFNGEDDNGDTLVDCADPQCRRLDACRVWQCPDGDLGGAVGMAVLTSSTLDATNDLAGSCGGQGGADLALTWVAPADGDYYIDTRWGSYDTVLYVRADGCDGDELACNDDATAPRALESELVLSAVEGRSYLIVIDGYEVVGGDRGGDFVLNITPVDLPTEDGFCTDRRDNDGDGFADCADDDCGGVDACTPLDGVETVYAGQAHTCALGDEAWCWGSGSSGELGDGEASSSSFPITTPGTWVELCAGARHTCGIDDAGKAWCWGDGWYGWNTEGGWAASDVPFEVPLPATPVELGCSTNHVCAALDGGSVRCWGRNDYGQLGDGTTETPSGETRAMIDIGRTVDVAVGAGHTCVVRESGEAWCTGLNNSGQLGAGPDWSYSRPQRVEGIDTATSVSAGSNHTCLLLRDGSVRCVGQNWQGQLGDGTTLEARRTVATHIAPRVAALDCGGQHCCAVDENADLWCWGYNGWGQLGVADTNSRPEPVRLEIPADIVAVSAGDEHTCAVTAGGGVLCWGGNRSGQLGDGTHDSQLVPTPVLSAR